MNLYAFEVGSFWPVICEIKMNIIYINLLIGIFLVFLILLWHQGYNFAERSFVDGLVGAFFGALAGASVIFLFQRKMEQTRYFSDLINRIDNIFSEELGWRLNTSTQVWEPCEFRRIVGMASWTEDPCGTDGRRHLQLHCSEIGIEWKGIVYKIDDNFRVASKPLHDYANWVRLLIDGYNSDLLSRNHIRFLWRSIVDAIAETEYDQKKFEMKKWTEFFVLGYKPANNSKRMFDKIVRIISKHSPSKQYLKTKANSYR
jgi:hypothetical protein